MQLRAPPRFRRYARSVYPFWAVNPRRQAGSDLRLARDVRIRPYREAGGAERGDATGAVGPGEILRSRLQVGRGHPDDSERAENGRVTVRAADTPIWQDASHNKVPHGEPLALRRIAPLRRQSAASPSESPLLFAPNTQRGSTDLPGQRVMLPPCGFANLLPPAPPVRRSACCVPIHFLVVHEAPRGVLARSADLPVREA
mmetsp:Transcript_49014/g.149233  ORF Transcript_49014/g.149233 Transcript_49014/m.149233 type:complete len:200 (-) Transcript_49014:727-1326(-)